jgi:hypothetical protein
VPAVRLVRLAKVEALALAVRPEERPVAAAPVEALAKAEPLVAADKVALAETRPTRAAAKPEPVVPAATAGARALEEPVAKVEPAETPARADSVAAVDSVDSVVTVAKGETAAKADSGAGMLATGVKAAAKIRNAAPRVLALHGALGPANRRQT